MSRVRSPSPAPIPQELSQKVAGVVIRIVINCDLSLTGGQSVEKKKKFQLEGKETHGMSSPDSFTEPLTVTMEVLSSEPESGPEWVVRLNAVHIPEGKVSPIAIVAGPTNDKRMAEIQVLAFESLLSPNGVGVDVA